MGLFLWDSEPSKIFVGDTPISKVFLWDTQVRPSGWKPWANTIAYYKFDWNLNDSSGNSHTLSNTGSISYSTNPYAVNLSTSNYLYFNNTDTFNHDRTYNTWAYITARNQSKDASVLMCQWTGSQNRMIFCCIDYQWKLFFWFYGNDHTWTITSSLNQWVNVCYTYNYATKTYKAYINSVKDIEWINSTQYTIASWNLYMWALANTPSVLNYRVQWKLSEYILEDKARTAQEVADYYNSTKSDYGL